MTKQSWPPWREAGAGPFLGRSPDERRQALIKLAWISVWMLYLGSPISDLLDRHHALPAAICGWAGLVVFVTGYLSVALFRTNQPRQPGRVLASLATLSVVLSLTFGEAWLVLFVYTAVAFGAALPPRQARWAITACAGVLAGAGALVHADNDLMPGLLIPCLLSGFAMSGVRRLVFTMRELREARETIAHFAATEERLRLARDLHDLLGHSLSPDRRAGLRCQSSASASSSKIVRCDLRVRALPRIASPPG